ncbi:hypothetical protein Tco_1008031 [Tanacetum coccineum]
MKPTHPDGFTPNNKRTLCGAAKKTKSTLVRLHNQPDAPLDDDDDVMMRVAAAAETGGWGGRRVEESGCGDRIDPVMRSVFGLRRKSRRKTFPAAGGGGRVMAGGSRTN